MGPVMRRLDNIAANTGAAVLLVAHDNKAGSDVAGSYVVRARAKTILRLKMPASDAPQNDDEPTTPRRSLTVEGKLAAAANYALEVTGPAAWQYLGKPREVRAADVEALLAEQMAAGESGTATQLANLIERRKDDVIKALAHLVETGRAAVQEIPTGQRGPKSRVYTAPKFVPEPPEQVSPPEQITEAENPVQDDDNDDDRKLVPAPLP